MANYKLRGSSQTESIVMRCTKEDKAALKVLAAENGTSMSDLIRTMLINNKYIKPFYK